MQNKICPKRIFRGIGIIRWLGLVVTTKPRFHANFDFCRKMPVLGFFWYVGIALNIQNCYNE